MERVKLGLFVAVLSSISFIGLSCVSHIEISNKKNIEKAENIRFSDKQISTLRTQGFFLVPMETIDPMDPNSISSNFDEMTGYYTHISGAPDEYSRKPENAVFITSDLVLHVYHLLIDRSVQAIEEEKFYPLALSMSEKAYKNSLKNLKSKKDGIEIKAKTAAYFLVPLCILEAAKDIKTDENLANENEDYTKVKINGISPEAEKKAVFAALNKRKREVPASVYEIANEEIEKIMEAKGIVASNVYPGNYNEKLDYTQFTPRSHYTKNAVLRNYFRALMWYGKLNFQLKNKEATITALEIVKNMRLAVKEWEGIYNPTVFFVGKSDDLTYYEYKKIMDKIYGKDAKDFGDQKKLNAFIYEASKLRGPAIMSSLAVFSGNVPKKDQMLKDTKGFRFMGQRFIPDSYMFSSLTQGDEAPDAETGQRLPSMPTSLMVMSILGSDAADKQLDQWIKQEAPKSDKVIKKYMDKLKKEFNGKDEKTWNQNIYWKWLYTLKALFAKQDPKCPAFVKTEAWGKKCLLAVAGSWTELRHDTLLYAKQSGAEMGGGEGEEKPPVVCGYVEPNAEFFKRLLSLNSSTMNLIGKYNLLSGETSVDYLNKFKSFEQSVEFLSQLVDEEISSNAITEQEYEKLRTISSELEFIARPVSFAGSIDEVRKRDSWMGLIADVHTDFVGGKILYEAIGRPMKIYVLISDKAGTRITRGLTYSYYEFTNPLEKRMTDEDWQGIVYEKKGTIPDMPKWILELITK